MARKKTAYEATSTVVGRFYVTAESDRGEIVKVREQMKDAKVVEVDVKQGDRVEKGTLLPCIERSLIDRGVLVEKVVESKETLADVSGANESATQIEVEPMIETAETV